MHKYYSCMLGVLYTDFSGIIEDDQTFERLLSQLPANMQEQVKRYKRRENHSASLLGKLLIQKGLTVLKMVSTHSIADLRYSAYGRPPIKNGNDIPIYTNNLNLMVFAANDGENGNDRRIG